MKQQSQETVQPFSGYAVPEWVAEELRLMKREYDEVDRLERRIRLLEDSLSGRDKRIQQLMDCIWKMRNGDSEAWRLVPGWEEVA